MRWYKSKTENNIVKFIATDGNRLAYVIKTYKENMKNSTEAGEEGKKADVCCDVIIPLDAAANLLPLIISDGDVEISINESVCKFDIKSDQGNIIFCTRLIQGQFPKVEQLIPKESAISFSYDCENYEELFGIENIENKTLEERQQQAEAQWGLSGGQGWKYLENVFNNAGLKCKVIENIPVKDLGKQGYLTFGSTVSGKRVQYGGWKYRIVANGDLNIEGINKDPVKVIDYSKAVLIEFLEPITSGKYDNFVKLFLQIKPAEVIALVKVNIY